jgi:hypothetical protein
MLTSLLMILSMQAGLHQNKRIIYVMHDERPCTFFILEGVSQADAVVPGSEWFAMSDQHPAKETLNAMLLSAKISRQKVTVSTSGAIACGHAAVSTIALPD